MQDRDLQRKELYGLMKRIPLTAVNGIIKGKEGVLLIKREIEPFKGWWHLPGGFVRAGETLAKAAEREAWEETGLRTKAVKYLGVYDSPKRDPRGHIVGHLFLLKIKSGKIRGSREGWHIKYFRKPPKNIGFDHRKMIMDAME